MTATAATKGARPSGSRPATASSKAPRRRAVRWVIAGVVVGVLGAVSAFTLLAEVDVGDAANSNTSGVTITANFGLRRDTLTSSYTTPLCFLDGTPVFFGIQECPGGGGGTDSANETTSRARRTHEQCAGIGDTPGDRASATVVGDLKRVDPNRPLSDSLGCRYLAHGQAFPANQLSAVSQNVAFRDLAISLTADPGQPTEVRPGTYCGYVVVARSDNSEIPVPIVATVSSRGQMSLRLRVFLTLLFGALVGAAVKWMGEKYAPVAGLRRRQRRLTRRFGGARRFLPEHAQYDLAVIGDGISSLEPDGVEDRLIELEQQGDALAQFAATMQNLEVHLNKQKEPDYEVGGRTSGGARTRGRACRRHGARRDQVPVGGPRQDGQRRQPPSQSGRGDHDGSRRR